MEGLDIIGDFPLMPGQLDDASSSASSSASSASVSDAASVRATFGRVRVD
jgi:hypothetical protein